MFICKICGNQVQAGQAFCPKCGADVVENYETVCPACGTRNGSGSKYCARCGGILGVLRKPVCPVCGAKNLPGAKFCVSCGAPIAPDSETHADADVLDARAAKQKLDMMERERMQAVDKEISARRKKLFEERAAALKEVDDERMKNEEDFEARKASLESYKKKLNELGSEDVAQLKKLSQALKIYSVYYADPYTEIDEDSIDTEGYVCPACGTVNPVDVKACTHCGRSKARSELLLAKKKIKQSPPVKRKKNVIPAPEEDLSAERTPTFEDYTENGKSAEKHPADVNPETAVSKAADFSGPATQNPYYGFPFGGYPYPGAMPGGGVPSFAGAKPGEPYQMPPILQPVAFVPYVTQEQPLMQYAPGAVQAVASPYPYQQADRTSELKRTDNAGSGTPESSVDGNGKI